MFRAVAFLASFLLVSTQFCPQESPGNAACVAADPDFSALSSLGHDVTVGCSLSTSIRQNEVSYMKETSVSEGVCASATPDGSFWPLFTRRNVGYTQYSVCNCSASETIPIDVQIPVDGGERMCSAGSEGNAACATAYPEFTRLMNGYDPVFVCLKTGGLIPSEEGICVTSVGDEGFKLLAEKHDGFTREFLCHCDKSQINASDVPNPATTPAPARISVGAAYVCASGKGNEACNAITPADVKRYGLSGICVIGNIDVGQGRRTKLHPEAQGVCGQVNVEHDLYYHKIDKVEDGIKYYYGCNCLESELYRMRS